MTGIHAQVPTVASSAELSHFRKAGVTHYNRYVMVNMGHNND